MGPHAPRLIEARDPQFRTALAAAAPFALTIGIDDQITCRPVGHLGDDNDAWQQFLTAELGTAWTASQKNVPSGIALYYTQDVARPLNAVASRILELLTGPGADIAFGTAVATGFNRDFLPRPLQPETVSRVLDQIAAAATLALSARLAITDPHLNAST